MKRKKEGRENRKEGTKERRKRGKKGRREGGRKKGRKHGRVYYGSQFEGVQSIMETGTWGNWLSCSCNWEAERVECWYFACFPPFIQPVTPSHGMVSATVQAVSLVPINSGMTNASQACPEVRLLTPSSWHLVLTTIHASSPPNMGVFCSNRKQRGRRDGPVGDAFVIQTPPGQDPQNPH